MPQGSTFYIQERYDGHTFTVDACTDRDQALTYAKYFAGQDPSPIMTKIGELVGYRSTLPSGMVVSYEVEVAKSMRRRNNVRS